MQFFKSKRTQKLLQNVKDYNLKEESRVKFQNACRLRTIFNICILTISTFIRNLKMLRNDYLPAYALWILSGQLFFITNFLLVFFWNFQQFILIALREVKDNLQDSVWNKDKVERCLTNLLKVEIFLEYFEQHFAFQLTLISSNYIFSNITFVS